MSYSIDDKDLDDAALWAVLDSAVSTAITTRSHSATKPPHHISRATRPVPALKFPNFHSPPNPMSPRAPQKPQQYERHVITNSSSPPQKVSKSSFDSDAVSSLSLVRRTPTPPPCHVAEAHWTLESYLSPQIGKEVSTCSSSGIGRGEIEVLNVETQRRHCLNDTFPSVSVFKKYQNDAMAILEKSDITMISGNPFIKKSGWRKISLYFNVSYEIKDKTIEFDENRNVQRAEFIVRAHMQGGRFSDGWGSCERREKRFMKPNHDIPSTAETRAKNKACQDLLGIGEYQPGTSQIHK